MTTRETGSLVGNNNNILCTINADFTGSCVEVSGFVAGGGAIELVAEKGCITISKKHSGFYRRQMKKTINVVAV